MDSLLEQIPLEIIYLLISFLGNSTLASLARTSKKWNNLLQSILLDIALTQVLDYDGWSRTTVLQWAAMNLKHRRHTFEGQLRRGADIRIYHPWRGSLLHIVAVQGDKDAIKQLIKAGLEPTLRFSGQTALRCAAEGGHVYAVGYLLFEFFDQWLDSDLQAAACCAAAGGHLTVLSALLPYIKFAAGYQYPWNPIVAYAAEGGDLAILYLLVYHGAVITPEALSIAAEKDDEAFLEELLILGARDIAKQTTRCTPLHIAARRGCVATVTLLIRYGADPNIRNLREKTPLYLARLYGHDAIVTMLAPITEDDTLLEGHISPGIV